MTISVPKVVISRVPLDDLLEVADSGTWGDDATSETGSPVLRSTNIQDNKLNLSEPAWRIIPRNDIDRRRLRSDDILVTKSSGSENHIGKCGRFEDPGDGRAYYFSNFMLRLRSDKEKLSPRYLFHWLASDRGRAEVRRLNSTTSGLRNISVPLYLKQHVPIPYAGESKRSLAEQERIASILDKADSVRRRRRSALELTTQLADSLFLDLFGDPHANPKGWPLGHISDLSADVQYGTSKKAGAGRLPILRMNNITSQGNWRLDDLKYIDLDDAEIDKFTVRAGDLLFNRTNSPDLVGKTAVFLEEQPMAYAGYLIRLRSKHPASADYISAFLNSRYGKAVLRGMCKHIIGMANINATELRNIPIPLPPLALQESYRKSMAGIRRLRDHFVRAADTADNLFHSLVQRAFRGEV